MKKRILSLILALSMVISVLPLGAFAEGSTGELVIGSDGYPIGSNGGKDSCSGNDWEYSNGALYLNLGAFNLSTTEPVKCEIHSFAIITGGTFNGKVYNFGTISGGTFAGEVTNNDTIENGTFEGKVTNNSTISGGTFQNGCIVTNNNTISGGNFKNTCSVTNNSHISDGTFEGTVTNEADGKINGGTFAANKKVENRGTITDGTFNGEVTNNGTIGKGTFNGEVLNFETIANGIFLEEVSNNQGGKITNGTFEQEVINNAGGEISGGTFKGTVLNGNGIITGGTFAAGLSDNDGGVTGGIFNGNANLTGVTGLHSITWDAASSKAEIEKVNDVSADWKPYAYKDTTVTITASTKIYSLNGKRIGTDYNSSYPNKNDKKTVTFTMPNENVVLSTGELVIGSDGYPVGSNGGKDFCSGNDWEYSDYSDTLYLSAGAFDLSTTEPVKCKVQSRTTITGGTFNGAVKIIAATITKGIFNETVYNSDGTISGGTFQSTGSVTNWGTITGGTFAGSVENKCDIYGGVFNRNATLTDVTGGHSITWDAASSGAKITEVNGVSAEWDPYVIVTDEAKTKVVTITADTDIFSLNGQPIGVGNCNSSYGSDKMTVTFTMPDGNVVLSTGELVMAGGWPVGSDDGNTSLSGN